MNWEALGAIAELLGAIGVIGSLVYLGMQIRHSALQTELNTKTMRATVYNQTISQISGWGRSVIALDSDTRNRFWKAVSDPASSASEDLALHQVLMGEYFFSFENLFRLHEQGMIDDDSWENSISNNVEVFRLPGFETYGESRDGPVSKRFWAHVQSRLSSGNGA
jgi:hypothetical protein